MGMKEPCRFHENPAGMETCSMGIETDVAGLLSDVKNEVQ